MAPRSLVLVLALGAGLTAIVVVFWLSRSLDDDGRGEQDLSMEARSDPGEPHEEVGDAVGLSVEDSSRSSSERVPEVVPSVPPPVPGLAGRATLPVDWRSTYEKWSLEELIREKERITSEFQKQSTAEIMKRFEAGLSEFVSTEMSYRWTEADQAEITGIQQVSNKGTYRTVLPRSEFQNLYEMKEKKAFLDALVEKKIHPPGTPK